MQVNERIKNIPLPTQDLSTLSFCNGAKASRVKDWIEQLRVTQTSQTGIALYEALPEINRLNCDAKTRFEILEAIRPATQSTISGLSKEFLNRPIVLPQNSKKTAIVAQSLQKHLIDGYILVARDIIEKQHAITKLSDTFIVVLHRAISGISALFLRNYQLYTAAPKNLWHSLHSLYVIAEHYKISANAVVDEAALINAKGNSKTTIKTAYLKTILLASSRPNQLGQNDLAALQDAFNQWGSSLKTHKGLSENSDIHYCVDLDSDSPPSGIAQFKSLEKAELDLNHDILELDFRGILSSIDKINKGLLIPISSIVKDHLISTWKAVPNRNQDRRRVQGLADICVGLSDLHYLLAKNQTFAHFMSQEEDLNTGDIHLDGITPNQSSTNTSDSQDIDYFKVSVQNVSRGGYCVLWEGDVPSKLEAGEVIGIKDSTRRPWTVCVIRWVRQCKQGAQLGLQVLSDRAQAFGAAQMYDMGGYSDFMRALYLPASHIEDTTASLLTPSAPFQAMDKVKVSDGEKQQILQLENRLFSTKSVQQFMFSSFENKDESN